MAQPSLVRRESSFAPTAQATLAWCFDHEQPSPLDNDPRDALENARAVQDPWEALVAQLEASRVRRAHARIMPRTDGRDLAVT